MLEIFSHQLTSQEIVLFCLVGLLMGMSKVGVKGLGMIAVPILAMIFGGKNSSGIMLPILIMADVFGASYYRRHAQWDHLKLLFPPAIIGVIAGTLVGKYIDDETFRVLMGTIILISVGIMLWLERSKRDVMPKSKWFAITIGILMGFTTMIGNLAGSVMALYLLVMKMPKDKFIGTVAWFFIIINVFKVPFHVIAWKTIDLNTLLLDLTLLPIVALGAFVGIKIVKRIPDKGYRYFVIIMTLVAAMMMVV